MKKLAQKIIALIKTIKPQDEKKKKVFLLAGILLVLILVIMTLLLIFLPRGETVTYKETQVQKGKLASGVTETGSVDVGTTTQSFEPDISEYTGESTYSWNIDMQGMGGMMSFQMQDTSNTSSSGSRQLVIEEVYVEAGQEIKQGEPLLKLTEDSVNNIRTQLAEDVADAKNVYDQAATAQKQAAQNAQSELKMNTLYGTYVQAEYSQTIEELQKAAENAQETLNEAEEALAENEEALAEKQALLTEEKQVLANAEYMANGTDRDENLYWWIIAVQTKNSAREMLDNLEEEIENLQDQQEEYSQNVTNVKIELELANKQLEGGMIQAQTQSEIRNLNYENAQEIYDVTTEQSDFDVQVAREDYEEAERKLTEFDQTIIDQIIFTDFSGLITEVAVTKGDTLEQDKDMIILNDYEAITITLSVEEDDMEAAALGNMVNVTIPAFPEEVFKGEVTEIGDAEIDSNTNKTLYSVTVTIEGTGDLLYQDMTAEVTFVSEETAEVLYIPNRTIVEEEESSYVKIKDKNGRISTKQVVTGFTDGVNTEIKEGLSEGETVLWESKVKS